MNMKLFRRNH